MHRSQKLKAEFAEQLLDLVAIATVADVMPLLGINRDLVLAGLDKLRQSSRPGIKELCTLAGIEQANLTAQHIGFALAPRINALGRLSESVQALRLLCTNQIETARKVGLHIQAINQQRQTLTQESVTLAETQIADQTDQTLLIVASETFHEGIIGLVAGRVAEKTGKPTLAFALGETFCKASMRSVEGFPAIEFVRRFSHLLLEAGGHPLAAGLACSRENYAILISEMQAAAKQLVDPESLSPTLRAECQISPQLLSVDVCRELSKFEPFGQANPQPRFVVENCRVLALDRIGRDKTHLKIKLLIGDQEYEGLVWQFDQQGKKLELNQIISVLAELQTSHWNGTSRLQLIVKDWH